jgi:hypothetical protein
MADAPLLRTLWVESEASLKRLDVRSLLSGFFLCRLDLAASNGWLLGAAEGPAEKCAPKIQAIKRNCCYGFGASSFRIASMVFETSATGLLPLIVQIFA